MNNKKHIYFVGIGGIGMSALARYFFLKKYKVAGYDLTSTDLTQQLEQEGIPITYLDNIKELPEEFTSPKETIVVYTPAIPQNHAILNWFQNNNFEILKRARLLGKITYNEKTIAVAGTHGKTSISTFTAHLLYQSSQKCNAFLGGISANYHTNLLFNKNAEYTVIEADEYDRSFLSLNPTIALISSIDADHLDIYENIEHIYDAFNKFALKTCDNEGQIIVKNTTRHKIKCLNNLQTYSVEDTADYHPRKVHYKNGKYEFDLHTPKGIIKNLSVNLVGTYNLENAIAASVLALQAGISENELRSGLLTLKGVDRRFQIRLTGSIVYIDDYAHHPVEIEACISSAKAAFPAKKITVAFQPHLFSRTKDFYKEFGKALNQADIVYLLPIYPAREKPISNVSSKLIANEMDVGKAKLIDKITLINSLSQINKGIFISMGAGDIGQMANNIEKKLKRKKIELD